MAGGALAGRRLGLPARCWRGTGADGLRSSLGLPSLHAHPTRRLVDLRGGCRATCCRLAVSMG